MPRLEVLLRTLGLFHKLHSSDKKRVQGRSSKKYSKKDQKKDQKLDQKLADCVLVSVDFENTDPLQARNLAPDLNAQVGLAVLDTRDLKKSAPPDQVISTYNFVCGSSSYVQKAFSSFIFGIPVEIKPNQLLSSIKSSIPKGRNIIFIAHNTTAESCILSRLGFDHSKMKVLAWLDTYPLSGKVLPWWALKLQELLTALECSYGSYEWLHNGGNDANFTLRALLLLAVEYLRRRGYSGDREDYLRALGHLPLPDRPPGLLQTIADGELATAEAGRAEKKRKRIEEATETIGHPRKCISDAEAGEGGESS